MVGRQVIALRVALALCFMGCTRARPAAEFCSIVGAVLKHQSGVPNEPVARRVSVLEDPCVRQHAFWHGAPLIDVRSSSDERIFKAAETCSLFAVHHPERPLSDPPESMVRIELVPDGQDAYRWHWAVYSIDSPTGGACAPANGRVEKRDGQWIALDLPFTSRSTLE
jgi:hypothetical protein